MVAAGAVRSACPKPVVRTTIASSNSKQETR